MNGVQSARVQNLVLIVYLSAIEVLSRPFAESTPTYSISDRGLPSPRTEGSSPHSEKTANVAGHSQWYI